MRILLFVLLVGCGRIGFDVAREAPSVDAVLPAGDVWESWKLAPIVTAPRRLDELVDGAARLANPSFAGETQLYYQTNANGSDLLAATRARRGEPWSLGTALPIDTAAEENRISLSDDGLIGIFIRISGPTHQLVQVTRASIDAPFAGESTTPFAGFASSATRFDPEVIGDGRRIYFSEGDTIYVASRSTLAAPFDTPVAVPLGLPASDPTLSPDELVIVFSSSTTTMRDLYFATRASREQPFGTPRPVPATNTSADEGDADLSADGRELVFSSNRDMTSNNRQLWVATVE